MDEFVVHDPCLFLVYYHHFVLLSLPSLVNQMKMVLLCLYLKRERRLIFIYSRNLSRSHDMYGEPTDLIGPSTVFYSPIDCERARVDGIQDSTIGIYFDLSRKNQIKYNFCAVEQVKFLLKQLDYSHSLSSLRVNSQLGYASDYSLVENVRASSLIVELIHSSDSLVYIIQFIRQTRQFDWLLLNVLNGNFSRKSILMIEAFY